MKKILKFLLPVPSIAILVFCGILLCFGEVDGVHIQIKDWLMFMVILFIFLILPLDIVFLAIKKIYFKLKLKREKINNPQPQPQPTIKAKSIPEKQKYEKEIDMYFSKAGRLIIEKDKASIGMLQRVYKIGFNHAARIMDQLCEAGVVGPEEGTNPRKILMSLENFEAFLDNHKFTYETKCDTQSIPREYELSEECEGVYSRISMYNNKFDNMNGHEFEYFCADLLRKNGFKNVEVTQGSGDHGIDILAEKDDISYAIQCKCYSKDIGNPAVQQSHTGKSIYKKDIAAVMTNRYFTPQAKDEAKILGVKLWDRDKLISLIKDGNKNDVS